MVYIVTGQLISELRYQDDESGPREQQMQGYTGSFLSDSGLQEWTELRGGIVSYQLHATKSIVCNNNYVERGFISCKTSSLLTTRSMCVYYLISPTLVQSDKR